jgi:hypothetical protein
MPFSRNPAITVVSANRHAAPLRPAARRAAAGIQAGHLGGPQTIATYTTI